MAYSVQSYRFHSRVINDLSDLTSKHDNLKLISTGIIYADSTCQNPLDQPISMELSVLNDLRVLAPQEITVLDADDYEIYKSTPALIEDSNIADDGDTSILWDDVQNKPDFPSIYLGIGANAVSASKLFTARTINGTTFDGTANISFSTDAVAEGTTNKYYTDARVKAYGDTVYPQLSVQYTNPTWLAGIDATTIKTGTIDLARLPAMPSANTIVCTTIPAMSAGDQLLVAKGTVVIESTTGNTYRYSGTGSVILNASYIQQSDMTPDWAVITNRPTLVSTWTNDAGYLTPASALDPSKVTQSASYRFATDAEKATWNAKQNALGNASATVSGILTSTDWATFNAKQPAGNYSLAGHTHLWAEITDKPTTFAPSAHTHAWSDITSGKPTTLAGYGITDAVSSSDSRLTDARTPINNANYVFGDNSTGSRSITDFNAVVKSGFGSGQTATGTPGTGWYHIITNKYHGDTTGWLFQIAAGFGMSAGPATPEGYYVRIKEGTSAPTAWRKLWHSGNFDIARVTSLETRMTAVDNNWVNYATAGHTHTFSSLTSKPTTLSGYGITDAATSTHNHGAQYIDFASDQTISGNKTFASILRAGQSGTFEARDYTSEGYTGATCTWFGFSGTFTANSGYAGFRANSTGSVFAGVKYNQAGYLMSQSEGNFNENICSWDINKFKIFKNLEVNGTSNFTAGVTFANGKWNVVGDDSAIGDINEGATLGLKGNNTSGSFLRFCNNGAANGSGIGQGFKIGYDGSVYRLYSGSTSISYTDSTGYTVQRGFQGYYHQGSSVGVTVNTYGGQWLPIAILSIGGQYGSSSTTFDVSNAYGNGTAGNWYSFRGTIKIKQQSAMSSTLDMCRLHVINCEGNYNPWTQLVAVLIVDTAVEKRVALYAQSPWSYDSLRVKVENSEGSVLDSGIGVFVASVPAGTQYTPTSSIRWDSNARTLHANDNLSVGGASNTGTNNVGRIASNLNNNGVASFIGNWNSNGYWGIAGSYAVNDYRIRITLNDSSGTISGWANLGAGAITSQNIAEMNYWNINQACAFFGLSGGNTNSWATSNGVGVGAGEIWLSNPTRFRVAIGTKTDALYMTATYVSFGMPVYSTEFHSTGAFAGTGLFAGTGDGASLTTYNQKITSWYGTGIYDACNNVCTGYIDNRLGKLYLKGDIVTEKWVYAAKFVGPIDASGGSVTVGSLTGTAGAYFTNGCSAAFFTSGVSTISSAGGYLGSNYNNIIAVTVAGVTISGAAQGRVQYIVNVSGSTVAFNMAGGGYYYAGSATAGTVSIPSKRTLVIIPVASTTDVYTYLM